MKSNPDPKELPPAIVLVDQHDRAGYNRACKAASGRYVQLVTDDPKAAQAALKAAGPTARLFGGRSTT